MCSTRYPAAWVSPSVAVAIVFLVVGGACHAAFEEPDGARRLSPEQAVWVDTRAGKVYVDGKIVLREGVLEMFACPEGTKEHESIVAVDAEAFLIHTALLAIGAEPGAPVRFDPEYEPPSGAPIRVEVRWLDEAGEPQSARAQEWVRNIDTGRAMELPFVFAGSKIHNDPQTGRQYYLANQGDLICVSNFGTAMLDVPAPSTQANAELLFEPFTERIPELDSQVRLVLSVEDEPADAAAGGDLDELQEAIATVAGARVGAGASSALREAWQVIAGTPPDEWAAIFAAMAEASPLASNWLRSAIDAASQQATLTDANVEQLRAVIANAEYGNLGRRAAYEVLIDHQPELREPLLETLLDDPDELLRFEAVGLALRRAESLEGEAQLDAYRKAISHARVLSQVEQAAEALEKLGEPRELTGLMGLITAVRLIGPFDNTEQAGFDRVYAPEDVLEPAGEYQGKGAAGAEFETVSWQPHQSTDRLGVVDLNTAVAAEKSAVAYAWVTVQSDAARDVELRYSSPGATKVWLNQKLVAANEIYHNGNQFDQFSTSATLREGENQLLVKVCQNDQPQPWAQRWSLQLRICDATGGSIEGVKIVEPEEAP